MKSLLHRCALLLVVGGMLLSITGCRYATNRYYDFRDTFRVGVGATVENPVTGPLPPSFGLYLEATDWLNLGWITHNGYTAELDLRGTFVGPESMTRAGLLWWQMLRINQDYDNAEYINPFKDRDFPWNHRMASPDYSFLGRPAKRLYYDHWANFMNKGTSLLHRGYQYWEYTGVELAICEPFITHFGVMARLGVDLSEVFDFVLGFAYIDFKRDDLTPEEYRLFRQWGDRSRDATSVSDQTGRVDGEAVPESAPIEGPRPGDLLPLPEMKVIYFDYDRSNIRPDQVPRMDFNLDYLRQNPDLHVMIEGHCDERGTIEYNFNLGLRRARAVRDYFINAGIDPSRLQVVSKGEEEPAVLGTGESVWSLNRRAEFKRIVTIRAVRP